MKTNRRKFSVEQKVMILRKHLVEKVPISEVCDQYGIKPTQFYQWQKQFFENGAAAFEKSNDNLKDRQRRNLERKVSHLESKLANKDEVIAEIMQSHVQLKKKLGQD
jgi:transposase-like protein